MPDRGKIGNRPRARQIKDFSSLRWGNITPTDIDCFVEFGGELFVVVEIKSKGKEMPYGQKLAFERLIDHIVGESILILAEHDVVDPDEDIDGALCHVVSYRYCPPGGKPKWYPARGNPTVKELIDKVLENKRSNDAHQTL
jgi:hypothetical protein